MYQRGGAGIPIMIAIVGGVVVFYIGYSMLGNIGAQDIHDTPLPAAPSVVQPATETAHAQSYVSFDDNFFQSTSGDFFIRVSSGVDASGKKIYTYVKAEIADVKTFHKVPVVGDSPQDTKSGKSGIFGSSGPAFYMDSQHVYFYSGVSVEIIQGADINTFQVLSPTYAKDANNVYVVHTTCDADGNCTGSITVIPGADPGSFQAFHDTVVPNPDGSGTVKIDAKDDGSIYYYGTWIGPLPDPDDHTLHPETDHPVLISP